MAESFEKMFLQVEETHHLYISKIVSQYIRSWLNKIEAHCNFGWHIYSDTHTTIYNINNRFQNHSHLVNKLQTISHFDSN